MWALFCAHRKVHMLPSFHPDASCLYSNRRNTGDWLIWVFMAPECSDSICAKLQAVLLLTIFHMYMCVCVHAWEHGSNRFFSCHFKKNMALVKSDSNLNLQYTWNWSLIHNHREGERRKKRERLKEGQMQLQALCSLGLFLSLSLSPVLSQAEVMW